MEMKMRTLLAVGLWVILPFALFAEGSSYKVSIKPSNPDDRSRPSMEFLPGTRYRQTNLGLYVALATAYKIPWQGAGALELRLKGVPEWMLMRYDMEIVATSPAAFGLSSTAPNDRIRSMLQAVFADRMKLKMRREAVEMAVFAVMVESGGAKLERAELSENDCIEATPFGSTDVLKPGCHQLLGGRDRGIRGAAVNMADIAYYVSNWSSLPIVDQTGLSGLYQIQTTGWAEKTEFPDFTLDALFDRLGLKLVRTKAPLEVFVIEHAERPSEN
jgi:uncharacterized protein (TIGR03435 family)